MSDLACLLYVIVGLLVWIAFILMLRLGPARPTIKPRPSAGGLIPTLHVDAPMPPVNSPMRAAIGLSDFGRRYVQVRADDPIIYCSPEAVWRLKHLPTMQATDNLRYGKGIVPQDGENGAILTSQGAVRIAVVKDPE